MKRSKNIATTNEVYYRLIALWVVCEALLGGIIHGLKLPVSGLIVGSSAVICICLIAFYVPLKGAILKATLIVCIFKMMLSPHSPLPAYFAVLFQGFLAEVIFYKRINYQLSCLLLGIIALFESAVQRIIVVTILYGENIWTAINDFVFRLTNHANNYSVWMICFYLSAHLLVGIIIGWFAAGLPERLQKWNTHQLIMEEGTTEINKHKSNRKFKPLLFTMWIFLMLLYLQSYFKIGNPLLPSHISLQIFLRSVIVVLTWYFLISPLLITLLKKWLQKKQQGSQQTISEILQLLPSIKFVVVKSWSISSSKKGIKRLRFFSKLVLINTLKNV